MILVLMNLMSIFLPLVINWSLILVMMTLCLLYKLPRFFEFFLKNKSSIDVLGLNGTLLSMASYIRSYSGVDVHLGSSQSYTEFHLNNLQGFTQTG